MGLSDIWSTGRVITGVAQREAPGSQNGAWLCGGSDGRPAPRERPAPPPLRREPGCSPRGPRAPCVQPPRIVRAGAKPLQGPAKLLQPLGAPVNPGRAGWRWQRWRRDALEEILIGLWGEPGLPAPVQGDCSSGLAGDRPLLCILFACRSTKNHSDRKRGNQVQWKREKDSEASDHLLQPAAPGFKPSLPTDSVPGPARESGTGSFLRTDTNTGNSREARIPLKCWPPACRSIHRAGSASGGILGLVHPGWKINDTCLRSSYELAPGQRSLEQMNTGLDVHISPTLGDPTPV